MILYATIIVIIILILQTEAADRSQSFTVCQHAILYQFRVVDHLVHFDPLSPMRFACQLAKLSKRSFNLIEFIRPAWQLIQRPTHVVS